MRRSIPITRLHGLYPGVEGLTVEQATERLSLYGKNNILEVPPHPWLGLARDTAKDPMIWFLFGTAIVYAVLGEYTEAAVLSISILPLVGMDSYLHRRTLASTAGLKQQLAQSARVIRDGVLLTLPASEIVPGDVIRVGTGESFPADGVIIEGSGLQADESSLTGEAQPVSKEAYTAVTLPLNDEEGADSKYWGFAGTRLLTGQGMLRIAYTGQQTLYGEIVRMASSNDKTRTPLQKSITNLVTVLLISAGILCLILAGVRYRQGHSWIDAFISAATLAVAALPEEFPVLFSVFLGVGVYRLARRKILVRRAVSVENIGRITCICSDKTGTITEGQLRLQHLLPAAHIPARLLLFFAGLASRRETGDPFDTAILERSQSNTAIRRLATYPFTEDRRRETSIIEWQGEILAISKGAPETLLPMSALPPAEVTAWMQTVNRLAEGGHKVLACAWWKFGRQWSGGEPDRQGHFAGLLACEDPLREGVVNAVDECRAAAIRVLIVTGDHPGTARAIAEALGLGGGKPNIVLADELLPQLENGITMGLRNADVVARAMPAHKLTLVKHLQAEGELIAVTGDGVNDVPALQAADVGVAMGERGTRSAREVAAVVLMDDNFRNIVNAIAEGRQLYRNLRLGFQYLMMIHIPLVITATFIPLAGYPLLYLPIHIIWLEAIIHPTALLVFQELPPAKRLEPQPRQQAARFFSLSEWLLISFVGTLITAVIIWSYGRSLVPGRNIEHARAMALTALICADVTITAWLSRLRTQSAWIVSIMTLLSSFVLVQSPVLSHLLHLQALHADDCLIALLGGLLAVAVPMTLCELLKALARRSPMARKRH